MNRRGFLKFLGVTTLGIYIRVAPDLVKVVEQITPIGGITIESFNRFLEYIFRQRDNYYEVPLYYVSSSLAKTLRQMDDKT